MLIPHITRPFFKTSALVLSAVFLLCCAFTACPQTEQKVITATPQDNITAPKENISPGTLDEIIPARSASLDTHLVSECSGFAASKKYPGIFWTLSDSGGKNTIVAIRADGSVVKPPGADAAYTGVKVSGATNKDWECLTIDNLGRIIIGDIGNNKSDRRDLSLLVFPEPNPRKDTAVAPRKIPVRYADQTEFPDKKKRFDCEALFVWNGAVYVLTKRWSDTWTVLYRLQIQQDGSGLFTPVTAYNSLGLVTDAAISPNGRLLAVLTYHGLWVFVLPASGTNPLAGSVLFRPVQFPMTSWQAEALAFTDNDHVIIGTEQGDIYKIEISRLAKVR